MNESIQEIGPYSVEALIGRGVGVDYRATDTRLDRTVATGGGGLRSLRGRSR